MKVLGSITGFSKMMIEGVEREFEGHKYHKVAYVNISKEEIKDCQEEREKG